MTTRQRVINALTRTEEPGLTMRELRDKLCITHTTIEYHLKAFRRGKLTLVSTPDSMDGRVVRYRIEPGALAAAEREAADATPAPQQAPMSASQLEAAICAMLRKKANRRYPLSMDDICDQLGQPSALVRPAVGTLVARETLLRVKRGYFINTPPELPTVADSAWLPVAGPREVNVMDQPPYDGAELRPFTGRAGAMDAYALPSRGIRA